MLSKSEITSSCVNLINDKRSYLVNYQNFIQSRIDSLDEYATGNRGIEEIEAELEKMKSQVSELIDLCDDCKVKISNNIEDY